MWYNDLYNHFISEHIINRFFVVLTDQPEKQCIKFIEFLTLKKVEFKVSEYRKNAIILHNGGIVFETKEYTCTDNKYYVIDTRNFKVIV